MNPLKAAILIFIIKPDAENAEDLLYFFSAIFASRAQRAVYVQLPTRTARLRLSA